MEQTETIEIRGADPVDVACATTPRGPIVLGEPASDEPTPGLQWTALHGTDTTFESLWPMLTAPNIDGFEATLRPWVIPVNNVLGADTAGNISFQLRGRLVERPTAGLRFQATTATVGPGSSPFPSRGSITGATPTGASSSLPTTGSAMRRHTSRSTSPVRPTRSDRRGVDGARTAATDVAAMTAIHLDVRSPVAAALLPLLLAATPTTATGRDAQTLLSDWNGELTAESCAATVYSGVRLRWAHEVADRLGPDDAHLVEADRFGPDTADWPLGRDHTRSRPTRWRPPSPT